MGRTESIIRKIQSINTGCWDAMTAMLERAGYNAACERTRKRRIKLGIMRGRYAGGARSWNNRVRAIMTYVRGIYKRHTALDRE